MSGHPEPGAPAPATHFAPAPRAPAGEVERRAIEVMQDPLVSTVVGALGGIVAVLNRHRQILAVNEGLLRLLGVIDGAELLGLRLGESLRCVHATDWPGGCGTSRFCSTCGAAIATVLAQQEGHPEERECLLAVRGARGEESIELKVRAVPMDLGAEPGVLLLLQDIRNEKRREVLERIFLHDLSNVLGSLACYSSLFAQAEPQDYPSLAARIESLSHQLVDDVLIHKTLLDAEQGSYVPRLEAVDAAAITSAVGHVFAHQAGPQRRTLEVETRNSLLPVRTDQGLVTRVLVNMVKNAMEATPVGGVVRLTVSGDGTFVRWQVQNPGGMPEPVAMRVFQRHFSTKPGPGRGYGTYSMKLLGERCLGGNVSFTTSEAEGTSFLFELPAGTS